MRVVQINSVANSGSTGRIAEQIGHQLIAAGHESHIAFGRRSQPSTSHLISLNDQMGQAIHLLKTRLLDRHGFASGKATAHLLRELDKMQPDIVHVHNLHGYYLHIGQLFNYLKTRGIPVVFTLHDCWTFTGHCSHFESVGCNKWQSECHHCPNKAKYPGSWGLDQSTRNFRDKKALFTGLKNAVVVTPSTWLKKHVESSFLSEYPVETIYNGVDLSVFQPGIALDRGKYGIVANTKIILGVASTWTPSKGLSDFIQLRALLSENYQIVLVGLTQEQINTLPSGITGINRTENTQALAALYGAAEVLVNPTYADNFPSVNIEALACGTPVVTYETGGSPEAVSPETGCAVPQGNLKGLYEKVIKTINSSNGNTPGQCRKRAEECFDQEKQFAKYIHLYQSILAR